MQCISRTISTAGDHLVYVKCAGKPLKGSPFLARVFDPSLVFVKELPHLIHLSEEVKFTGKNYRNQSMGRQVPSYVWAGISSCSWFLAFAQVPPIT